MASIYQRGYKELAPWIENRITMISDFSELTGDWRIQTKLQFTIDYKSKMKTLYNRG